MIGRSERGSIGGAWLVAGLGLGLGCNRDEASAEPGSGAADCNPADDCNDMFGGSTVRQHSDRAATWPSSPKALHVVAVSVRPSPGLDHPSVVACARRALQRHRFPRFDGGQRMLNYTVTIEAVPGDG